jgi:hypothetical protein
MRGNFGISQPAGRQVGKLKIILNASSHAIIKPTANFAEAIYPLS